LTRVNGRPINGRSPNGLVRTAYGHHPIRPRQHHRAHQRTQAEQAGFKFDEVIADGGVSGVSTKLRERPQGRRLFDLLRSGDTLVVRWIDRLGRNYEDICETIREFMRWGVVIRTVINGITFDGATKDAMQRAVRDALIAFMAATAQAQAEATKEAQRAGIAHAKANGEAHTYKGRKPSYSRKQFESAQAMLGKSASVGEVARSTGLTRQTVYRIKDDPAGAEAALATWGV
jgi:putative DNA-invertase from lambdoid prophage Rac